MNDYKKWNDQHRFAGNAIKALERDGFKCTKCGMTNEAHIAKWKRRLTVDHIDGQGRYTKVQNNALENLRTLCLRCHGCKDGRRSRNFYDRSGYVAYLESEIRRLNV